MWYKICYYIIFPTIPFPLLLTVTNLMFRMLILWFLRSLVHILYQYKLTFILSIDIYFLFFYNTFLYTYYKTIRLFVVAMFQYEDYTYHFFFNRCISPIPIIIILPDIYYLNRLFNKSYHTILNVWPVYYFHWNHPFIFTNY